MSCKRIYAALLVLCFGVSVLTGCMQTEKENDETRHTKEIKIPIVLTVNPTTGKKGNQELVEAFNKEYQGVYRLDVEWVMETEEEYRKNLKRMNVTDELPALIFDVRTVPSFYRLMVEEGRIEDLTPYLEADGEWRSMIEPAVMEGCTDKDGAVYLGPISTAAFSCSGMFWNRELFEQAGIESFPTTWEEFWECCEKLQAHGIVPLALHTEGTAWAPMLIATAELADSEEGAEFMKELFPESYQNENGVHLASTLKRLFQYATEDALHEDFDVAYTDFFSGKAAMIPNGYWMIEQIPADWRNKIRFSAFPGNKMVSSPETFGWAVVSSYSSEVKEGAIEFLKFRTKYNRKEKEEFLAQSGKNISRVLQDYLDAFTGNPQIVPNYQVKWNSILQDVTLGNYLPELVEDEITAEEFTRIEDESIREYEEEQ